VALLDEHARSTSVRNDRFTGTGSSAERAQYLFANYPAGRLLGALPATFRCDAGDQHGPYPSDKCDLTDEVRRTVAGGDLYARSLLVKHERGKLELVTLYVVRGPGALTAVFVLLRRRAKARFDGLFGPGAT